MRPFLLCFLLSLRAFAWEGHAEITRLSLQNLALLQAPERQEVTYVPLNLTLHKGLTRFRPRSETELKSELKIHKKFEFKNRLGEKPGSHFRPEEVLAMYSDEPDWGPDQNLFEPDQFPELWNEDSPYITQRRGLKSQAFRHLHFPGEHHWSEPISSFQIPMHPIGEAPDRAALFYDLARDFFERGQDYWGFRFLAWSLHFVEDLFQPFHVRQIPTFSFVVFEWRYWLPRPNITQSGEKIGYYHLSYEKWLESETLKPHSPLRSALMGSETAPEFTGTRRTYLKNRAVDFAGRFASTVGRASYRLFAPFDPGGPKRAEDVVGSAEWKAGIRGRPTDEAELLSTTEILFKEMGPTVRRWTEDALGVMAQRKK